MKISMATIETSNPMDKPIIIPRSDLRDIILELREEQERNRATMESIIRQLSAMIGDIPRVTKALPFDSPFATMRKPPRKARASAIKKAT
jgi:hypothetical protein